MNHCYIHNSLYSFQKQNEKSRKGSKKSSSKKNSKGNAFSQKDNPDNIENGESDMENHQNPLGKRNKAGYNQKVRIENPAGKGEDSDEDEPVNQTKSVNSMNSSR